MWPFRNKSEEIQALEIKFSEKLSEELSAMKSSVDRNTNIVLSANRKLKAMQETLDTMLAEVQSIEVDESANNGTVD